MTYDIQYHDVVFVVSILIVWTVEVIRRSFPSGAYPAPLQRFFRDAFKIDYPNPGMCRIRVKATNTCLTLGNVFSILNYPSVVVTRQTAILVYTTVAVILCQYSYILQDQLAPQSLLWVLFFVPIQLFFQHSIGAKGSLVGSDATGPNARGALAPWFSYGLKTFFTVLSLCAGILCTRLAFRELTSRSWYIVVGILYCVSVLGIYLMEVFSPQNIFRSQTSSAEMFSLFVSNNFYLAFGRLEAFVHVVTVLTMIVYVTAALADRNDNLIPYVPYFALCSLLFSFVSNTITFAKARKSYATVQAYVANVVLLFSLIFGAFAISNSICARPGYECDTIVSPKRSGQLMFQILTFFPGQMLFLIGALGALMTAAIPHSMISCSKASGDKEAVLQEEELFEE